MSECKCSEGEKYFFKHSCRLKCVDLDYIKIWFFDEEKSYNYYLHQDIAELMVDCIIDSEVDVCKETLDLEEKYKHDLSILPEIINDFRKWYVKTSRILKNKDVPIKNSC